jgi:hypothetical protein
MFLIKGTRNAKIKTYTDHDHSCTNCRNFDMTVKVYKEYFHFFFIPIAATGTKSVKIKYNSCGTQFRSDSLNKSYEEKTSVPFYLYAGTILVALLILAGFSLSFLTQYERSNFVSNPKVGDVYLINHQDSSATSYYFARVMRINQDSVITIHNRFNYNEYVSEFIPADCFVSGEEIPFTKETLKDMLKKGFISAVERDYVDSTGFNRIE